MIKYPIYDDKTCELLFEADIDTTENADEALKKRLAVIWAIEQGESLVGADLSEADLSGLDLSGVDCTGALDGQKCLVQICEARFWMALICSTRFWMSKT
jgi:uncharacterized protein YjbI with pentapeptide repeats